MPLGFWSFVAIVSSPFAVTVQLILFSAFLFLNRASTDVCMSYDMCKRMRGMVVMKGFLWKVSKASKINLSK